MTWKNRLLKCTYDDITLFYQSDSYTSGRRLQVSEYPLCDNVVVDDLGKKRRDITLNAYVIGDDYDKDLQRLIVIAESGKVKPFIHPFFGNLKAIISDLTVKQSTNEQGLANVELKFVIHDEIKPVFANTRKTENKSADILENKTKESFIKKLRLNSDYLLREIKDNLNTLGSYKRTFNDLKENPQNIFYQLVGVSENRVKNIVRLTKDFLEIDKADYPKTHYERQAHENKELIETTHRNLIAIGQARLIFNGDLTEQQARVLRENIIKIADNSSNREEFTELIQEVIYFNKFNKKSYFIKDETPSIVVSYNLFGNIDNADKIKNKHLLFVNNTIEI